MKILTTNINQHQVKVSRVLSYPVIESPKDTFVKTSPSFKGTEKKIINQGAKTLLELSTFLTAGFVAFKKLTGDTEDLKELNIESENNPFQEFFNNLIGQKNRIQELEDENIKLKQQNKDLQDKLQEESKTVETEGELKKEETAEEVIEEISEIEVIVDNTEPTATENSAANTNPVNAEHALFPPKRGVLSSEQKKLKAVVMNINISPEYNDKLTKICIDIIKKGIKDNENRVYTINLASALEACDGDIEKLKEIIDKYSTEKKSEQDQECLTNPKSSNNSEKNNEIYDPVSARKLPGIKTVGSIDLSTIPDKKTQKTRFGTTTSENPDDNSKNPVKTETESSSEKKPIKQNPVKKKSTEVYELNIPRGIIHTDMQSNLTNALDFFEKQYIEGKKKEATEKGTRREYVKWSYRKPVGRVKKEDVLKEIKKCETRGERSKYYNINNSNSELVADAINSDSRFKELFTFHGATKFIERFTDFNSDESIESQVTQALDILENILLKALVYGISMEEHDDPITYNDKDGNKHTEIYKGTNLVIPIECYDEKAKKMFGSYPIKLGICRCGQYNKKAIICTIYPKGIY